MGMAEISVIVLSTGTRDRLRFIENLLNSLSKQTFKDFETITVVEELSRELENIVLNSPIKSRILVTGYWNKCKSLNKAVKEAKGSILVLLEDDLVLEPTFIEELVRTFNIGKSVGCAYSRCIWVFKEGLRSSRGLVGFVSRAISKLSVHEHLARRVKKIGNGLYEVPVFTMSVACRKDVLIRAGLWDESVEEPIQGEDYDIVLRITKLGYRIIQNTKAVSYHFTKQVTKKIMKLRSSPKYIMGLNKSEVYFIAKNVDVIGLKVVLGHTLYRLLESLFYSIKTHSLRVALYGIAGVIQGLIKGFSNRAQIDNRKI